MLQVFLTKFEVNPPLEKPDQPSDQETNKVDIKIKPIEPDKTKLYQRTQALFKKRRASRQGKKPFPKRASILELPVLVPREVYRPPSYLTGRTYSCSSERVLSSAGSSTKSKPSPKATVNKSKPKISIPWPPPKDTNYLKSATTSQKPIQSSQVARPATPDSPESYLNTFENSSSSKFVDCELCGKKNLSSLKQLQVHQASKKCRNRRDHFSDLRCTVCRVKFDTRHNLENHNCRFK